METYRAAKDIDMANIELNTCEHFFGGFRKGTLQKYYESDAKSALGTMGIIPCSHICGP